MSIDNPKLKAWITIKELVNDVLSDIDEHHRIKVWPQYVQWAIRGYMKINMFHTDNVEVVYLDPTDQNTVIWPDDLIDYNRIGVKWRDKFWELTEDSDLLIPREKQCGVDINPLPNIARYQHHPSYAAEGGKNFLYYREDKELRRFILEGTLPPDSRIVIEYVSNGVGSVDSVIPIQYSEAIIAFVHWQRTKHDRKASMNEKMMYKQDYYEECADLRSFEYAFTIREYLDARYSGLNQSIKRL